MKKLFLLSAYHSADVILSKVLCEVTDRKQFLGGRKTKFSRSKPSNYQIRGEKGCAVEMSGANFKQNGADEFGSTLRFSFQKPANSEKWFPVELGKVGVEQRRKCIWKSPNGNKAQLRNSAI